MIKYNFINKYKNIRKWIPDNSEPNQINLIKSDTCINFLLNKFSAKFPDFAQILFQNRILYLPSLTVLSFVLLLEIFSILPRLNLLLLTSKHFKYVDTANQMSDINRVLEDGYNSLTDYSELVAANSPSSYFAYHLQISTPSSLQLTSYTVDNNGFKINALGSDLDSVNQFISQLIMIKYVDSNSVRLLRLSGQPSNPMASSFSNAPKETVNIELVGTWLPINLQDRITYNENAKNLGMVHKLSLQQKLSELYDMTNQ